MYSFFADWYVLCSSVLNPNTFLAVEKNRKTNHVNLVLNIRKWNQVITHIKEHLSLRFLHILFISHIYSLGKEKIYFLIRFITNFETFYDVPPTTFLLVPFAHSTRFERDPSLTHIIMLVDGFIFSPSNFLEHFLRYKK